MLSSGDKVQALRDLDSVGMKSGMIATVSHICRGIHFVEYPSNFAGYGVHPSYLRKL